MGLYAGKAGRQWCLGIACLRGSAARRGSRLRTVRPRPDLRRRSRIEPAASCPASRLRPRKSQTQTAHTTVTDASGFYTFPNLSAGPLQHQRRAPGIQEGAAARTCSSTRPARSTLDFALETGALTEEVTVTAEPTLLQTDVALAQDRRGEGHRAAVVLGPQPDRRRRPEAGRHRRQLQQLRLLGPRQRRLQHQRQPRPTRTTSPSTARPPSAPGRTARSSASRTSTRSRKSRC